MALLSNLLSSRRPSVAAAAAKEDRKRGFLARIFGFLRVAFFLAWTLLSSLLFALVLMLASLSSSSSLIGRSWVKLHWSRWQAFLFHYVGLAPELFVYSDGRDESIMKRISRTKVETKVDGKLETKVKGKLEKSKKKNPNPSTSNTRNHDLVVISNHQIYFDWLYLWWFLDLCQRASDLFIVLRADLRKIPVLGWAMDRFGFIFVNRDWGKDKSNFVRSVTDIAQDPLPSCLLLFPEGTILTRDTVAKMKAFAESKGLSPTSQVLLPKTTGTFAALRILDGAREGGLEGILNLTVGYSGVSSGVQLHDKYRVLDIIKTGRGPMQIHLLAEFIPRNQIPLDDEERFKIWMRDLFYAKDRIMTQFYSNGCSFANTSNIQLVPGFNPRNLVGAKVDHPIESKLSLLVMTLSMAILLYIPLYLANKLIWF